MLTSCSSRWRSPVVWLADFASACGQRIQPLPDNIKPSRKTQPSHSMNTKHTLLLTSGSALAAGMAQGAVHYSGPVNTVATFDLNRVGVYDYFDLNNDGTPDYAFGFDGYSTANYQKPFISGYLISPPGVASSAVLSRPYNYTDDSGNPKTGYGLPVTAFGTMIDQNFLTPNLDTANQNRTYFDQNGDGKYIGDWLTGAKTEGYIGLELFDTTLSTTNYGWAHIIFDDASNPQTLTVVDFAYEDGNLVGIIAGATNTVGIPTIYSQPQSQAVPIGAAAQFTVTVLADPAPAYQWKAGVIGSHVYTNLTNGGAISGANSNVLTLSGASSANMLDYIVVVTNTLGAATSSPPATLTVFAPVASPTPQTLYGGLTGKIHVTVAAGLSATYRWRQDGANLADDGRIAGSATPNLTIGNLQTTDSGSYDLVLILNSGSVTSSVASLTILPPGSESTYEAAVLAARPWAYYRLNETGDPTTGSVTAWDNAGGYNGLYGLDVTNGATAIPGPRPADGFPGFAPNNFASMFATNDPDSRITLAPWRLNSAQATFVAWINPADPIQFQQAGVVMTGTTNNSYAGIRYYWQVNTNLNAWTIGYAWNDLTGSSVFWDTQIAPPANQWSMIGVVVTPSNSTVYVFNTNGVSSAFNDGTVTNTFGPFTNQVMGFETPEYIGTNPDGISGQRNFNGVIDEVAVFNRPLAANDLQTLYNAALGTLPPVTLQTARAGSNVQLVWGTLGQLLEASGVKGPWTTNSLASSPYTVPASTTPKFYRVLVH